jgi:hypothetical protein
MGLLIIKLALTPLLMWLVSYASRKWGTQLGGLLSGLPLTSGPISIYLLIEQGREFAAQSAISSLAGVGAISIFWFVYSVMARRFSVHWCVLISLGIFVAEMSLLQRFHLALWLALAADLAIITVILRMIPMPGLEESKISYPRWDLPARMATATGMVVLVTFTAHLLGPNLSGLLSPIPILALPLCVFAHVQQGEAGAQAVACGNLRAAYGVTIFYAMLGLFVPGGNLYLAYMGAFVGSALAVVPWLSQRRPAINREED